MDIEAPDTSLAGAITDMWVDLAAGQQTYGSHLLADSNRTQIREAVVRHIVTDTLLVARGEEDDLAGFIMFSVESGSFEQDVRRGLVENLFVAEPHRNEAVGANLLAGAERVFAERDVDVVALEVMHDNDEARDFYREHGYSPHRVELEKRVQSDTHSRDDA